MTRALVVMLLPACFAAPAAAQDTKPAGPPPPPKTVLTVAGRVFDDRNADGVRQDGEPGLPGVWVSNGIDLKRTDAEGRYSLPLPVAQSRCVFVVIPGGYELTDRFYLRVALDETRDQTADFGLVRRSQPVTAEGLRFVQVTDVHASTPVDAVDVAADVREINALPEPVEFVISTGDLTNRATAIEFECYLAGMRVSRRPVRHCFGNHEVDKTAVRTDTYERYCGPTYYAFEVGPVHCVCLDSVHWTARQQERLKFHLGTVPPERPILVFQHYPPTKALLDMLAGWNVRAVFSGHVHGTRIAEYRGIFNCNSTTLKMGAIDRTPRGFQIVAFADGKVRTRQFLGGAGRQWTLEAAAAASAPPVRPGADFAMAHGDAGSTGAARDVVAPPLTPAWSAYAGGIVHIGSPVVADGKVFVGTLYATGFGGCGVTALDAATGRRLWRTATDGCIKNTPAAGGGRVYALSVLGTAYCLDAATGKVLWTRALGDPAVRWEIGAPKLADGVVYLGSGNHLTALDAQTGAFVWKGRFVSAAQPPKDAEKAGGKFLERANVVHDDWWPHCYQTPAVGPEIVWLGGRTGLYAVDRRTGRLLGSRTAPGGAGRSPVLPMLAGGRVIAAFSKMTAFAADAENKQLWQADVVVGDETGTPAIADGVLLYGTYRGEVIAADAATGRTLWRHRIGKALVSMLPYRRDETTVTGSPTISGGTVYLTGNDGVFYAFDLKTGRVLDRHEIGVPMCGAPAVSGNAVWFAGLDGVVRCFVRSQSP